MSEWLAADLQTGETVQAVVIGQPKRGTRSQLLRAGTTTAVASTVASVAAGALMAGSGMLVLQAPPAAWCVRTDQRLLLFAKVKGYGRKRLGAAIFAAPRSALRVTVSGGLMSTVALLDAADDVSLLQVRFGLRHGAARALVGE